MGRAEASADGVQMLCRGCAAKLPAAILEAALRLQVGDLATAWEDAALVPTKGQQEGAPLLQSVDGFPALISDPWLNGRLTALHACSDLWACGSVQSPKRGHPAPELIKHSATPIDPNRGWDPLS